MAALLSFTSAAEPRTVKPLEVPHAISFDLIGPLHPQRFEVETAISQRFSASYGADIKYFMPIQLSMRLDNEIVATLGVRQASQSALFLENYFDQPIEQFAAAAMQREILRGDIVEIGNLASIHRGGSQWLFITLTLLLCDQNLPWVAFTATPEVQKLLRRLNIQPHALTSADADRLGANKADWGNYYQQQPQVMITHARAAKKALLEHPQTMRIATQLGAFVQRLNAQWQVFAGEKNVCID